MYRKSWVFVLLAIVLVATLPACTRSASTAAEPTATAEGDFPFPVPTSNALQSILSGTQTAQAKGNVNTSAESTAAPTTASAATTDTSVLPTATPSGVIVLPTSTPAAALPTATPTKAVVATWVPTAGVPTTYTLHEGEYPYCIARRFNINAGELLNANNLSANSAPAAGTTLTIPSSASAWGDGRARLDHPTTYTVASGDTVYSIACDFGDVDPNAIITVNGLKEPYTLTAGQKLQIP